MTHKGSRAQPDVSSPESYEVEVLWHDRRSPAELGELGRGETERKLNKARKYRVLVVGGISMGNLGSPRGRHICQVWTFHDSAESSELPWV